MSNDVFHSAIYAYTARDIDKMNIFATLTFPTVLALYTLIHYFTKYTVFIALNAAADNISIAAYSFVVI